MTGQMMNRTKLWWLSATLALVVVGVVTVVLSRVGKEPKSRHQRKSSGQHVTTPRASASNLKGRAKSPIWTAIDANNFSELSSLIREGADPNVVDPDRDNRTPLMGAAGWCDSKFVELLITSGANINGRDAVDATPLMFAIEKGNFDNARVLVNGGADLNAVDSRNKSVLMYANEEHETNNKDLSHADWLRLVQFLKRRGAK